MEDQDNKFGLPKKKKSLDKYINKYIIITMNGESVAGNYIGQDENGLHIFSPFQGVDYLTKDLTYKIFDNPEEPMTINLPANTFFIIKPTSKKSLENYCEHMNKHQELRAKKEDQTNK